MTTHSRIGASSMYRWKNCPGSVRLSAGVKSESSAYAEEGTAAHDLAERCLRERVNPGALSDNRDMCEAVQVYLDHIWMLQGLESPLTPDLPSPETLIEHKFHLQDIHPDLFGTADFVMMGHTTNTLYVRDYKHGSGKFVDVEDNDQLMYYATGALLSNPQWKPAYVDIGIVQPRFTGAEPVRAKRMPVVELLDFIDELTVAARRCDSDNAPCNPGTWCDWCPAAGFCKDLANYCTQAAEAEFRDDCTYVAEELTATLDKLPVIEKWVKAVREFAYREAEHGRCPPRYKLVDKEGRRKWRDEAEAVEFFRMLGWEDKEIFEEPSARSVAQLEKAVGKEHRATIAAMVVKESSGLALVHETDKRPPAKVDAASEFSAMD